MTRMQLGILVLFITLYLVAGMDEESIGKKSRCSKSRCCREGPQGNMGTQGIQGPMGRQGVPGRDGMNGLPGQSGLPGIPGIKGEQGDVIGYLKEQALNEETGEFTFLRGPRGFPGPRGLPGPSGFGIGNSVLDIGAANLQRPLATSQYQAATTPVAFTNVRTYDMSRNGDHNKDIKFNNHVTNIDSRFNTENGHFLCFINGTYFFSFSIAHNEDTRVELVKNGKTIVGIHGDTAQNKRMMYTNSAVVELVEGDQVWLRLIREHSLSGSTQHLTTFTGFLLYPNLPWGP